MVLESRPLRAAELCIVGVSQLWRLSTMGLISSRSRSVIQIAGWSDRTTHVHRIAQPTNATNHAMAGLLSSLGRGGGSPDGRRWCPWGSRAPVATVLTSTPSPRGARLGA